ncbi:MAG: ATP-binding protein [Thermoguttaceae bacterium]
MFLHRFYTGVLIGNLLLVSTSLVLGGFLTFLCIEAQIRRDNETMQMELLKSQTDFLQQIWSKDETTRSIIIREFCGSFNNRHTQFRVTIIDTSGKVLGDSEENPNTMTLHNTMDRPEMMAALAGHFGADTRKSATTKIDYRYFALPIYETKIRNETKSEAQIVGAARLAMPVAGIVSMQRAIVVTIIVNLILVLVLTAILSAGFAWFWYRPLKNIHAASRNLARGDLETPILVEGPMELAHLSAALEQMRNKLIGNMQIVKKQYESLQTIFDDIDEAIIAMNQEDQIIYCNSSAKSIFDLDDFPEGKSFWSILRSGPVLSIYEQMKTSREEIKRQTEIAAGRKRVVLEVQAFPISVQHPDSEIAALLIARDQTEAVRTSRMKTDFVANASHELRTPLATIRASLDNLLDEIADDPETMRHLLSLLDRNVSRLEAMVRDLLDLHIVENEEIPNKIKIVSGDELKAWLLELFSTKITEKKISFDVNCLFSAMKTDPQRLQLILQNLVDNAIKFSEHGGNVSLKLSLSDTENTANKQLVIECRDAGCGIPQSDQVKVFDRFYQANGSKSGDNRIRGTGLGLSIIKHAVDRLGGVIHLNSIPGVGTTVVVEIPCESC